MGNSCWAGVVTQAALWEAKCSGFRARCVHEPWPSTGSHPLLWAKVLRGGGGQGQQWLTGPAFGRYPHHLRPQVPAGVQEFTRGQDPSLLPAPDPRCHIPGPVQPRQAGGAQGAE